MSKFDVLRSVLRSTARSARDSVLGPRASETLSKLLQAGGLGATTIDAATLTIAVTRAGGIEAATVAGDRDRLRVDLRLDREHHLQFSLFGAGVQFAPGGAKEISFRIDPAEASAKSAARDAVAAIGGEIAKRLWGPVLAAAPAGGHSAFVSETGSGRLFLDLRTVPEVRWAMSRRLQRTFIEAIRLERCEITDGAILLTPSVEGLRRR
ncbi:MAG: hypothetical protein OEZ06_26705 [Myxococcales bacterium]|nr:hypothetical protein [Myxococcales bacterium]